MDDFLKTTAGLHALEKIGQNRRAQEALSDRIKNQNEEIEQARHEANMADSATESERRKTLVLKEEIKKYETLLAKPMQEIAQQNGNFRETYEKQQEILANWVVSQKAFKELAMKYGKLAGKTPEQIQQEGLATKEVILTDSSEFGNVIEPGTIADQKREVLLKNIKTNK